MDFVIERLTAVHASGIGNTKEAGCMAYRWEELALCDAPQPLLAMLDKGNSTFQYGGRVKERYSDKVIAQI